MQSSSVVTFRALVMLSCLVAVPLAAVFGTSLPDVVGALLEGRLPGRAESADGATGDAPRFEPVAAGEMASIMPPRRLPGAAESTPLPPVASSPRGWDGSNTPGAAMSEVVPAGYDAPVFESPAFNPAIQPPGTVASQSADQFTYIQDRLKQLGATYYLLEMFEEQQYRFHCCIPVGGNSSYNRKYEAVDPSPLGAMIKVLQQVEGRSPVGP